MNVLWLLLFLFLIASQKNIRESQKVPDIAGFLRLQIRVYAPHLLFLPGRLSQVLRRLAERPESLDIK